MSIAVAPALTVVELQRMLKALPDRLRSKIVEQADGCWGWAASKTHQGYGRFRMGDRNALAHRVVYEHLVGPIATGMTLDHLCRNRACVNPAHLEPLPLRENILRGRGVGAVNADKTHCKHGHEFTPENTYLGKKSGQRHCRECGREANRRFRRKADA